MEKRLLNSNWELDWKGKRLNASVPCSVVSTLLSHHEMEDPYFSDNEKKVQAIFEDDYAFLHSFDLAEEDLKHERVLLEFDCLDTVCDIFVNEQLLSGEKNMFRKYRFDASKVLKPGSNTIRILFHSPVKYLREHKADLGKPFNVIRKAGCMFGWDWGITLPDSGILGNVSLILDEGDDVTDLYVRQKHLPSKVVLQADVSSLINQADQMMVRLYGPDGELISEQKYPAKEQVTVELEISSPKLWMPVGYGAQPLYKVEAHLIKGQEEVSGLSRKIGLRTVRIDESKDGKGHKFEIVVNDTPVYFRGESLIINDAIIPNITDQTWKNLIQNALKSNLNGIRVWGGAYYPEDVFYEYCDEAGLMVYQDFMFACTFYYPSQALIENIEKEVEYQIKRIRNHASLVLWCGNNELDCLYTAMTSKEPRTTALRKLFKAEKPFDFKTALFIRYIYSKIFLKLIPSKVKQLSPQIPFIHSTPHSHRPLNAKSFFDYAWDGDIHYYLQYDGNAPYQIMQTKEMLFRFVSEIGFQSYPSIKTLRQYISKEDLSPYSDVMYAHQKCFNGNETIELYMDREYVVPEDFEDYVYLSQVQAAEIMRYTVEYQRRHNDYNRGVILWQMNDCWPVVSWSGIDYCGRWKAEQYLTRKYFAPVMVSCEVDQNKAAVSVTTDLLEGAKGEIKVILVENRQAAASENDAGDTSSGSQDPRGESRREQTVAYDIKTGSKEIISFDRPDDVASSYLAFYDGKAWNVQLFGTSRQFSFEKPQLSFTFEEDTDSYLIGICSNVMCKDVMLDLSIHDAVFEDNCFDLIPDEIYKVRLKKTETDIMDLEQLKEELTAKTLNDVMLGKVRKGASA